MAIVVGALMLVMSLGTGGVFIWSAASDFDWYPYKPMWMLYLEVKSNDPAIIDRARTEVFRRLTAGSIDAQDMEAIIDYVLQLQSDLTIQWDPSWGNFLNEAWKVGGVSSEHRATYAKTAYETGSYVKVTPLVRITQQPKLTIGCKNVRLGVEDEFELYVEGTWPEIDGEPCYVGWGLGRMLFHSQTSGYSSGSLPVKLEPGRHTLVLKGIAQINPFVTGRTLEEIQQAEANRKLVAEWPVRYELSFEVVPDDYRTVGVINDPALAQTIRDSLSLRKLNMSGFGGAPYSSLVFDCMLPPVSLSFDIIIRVGEQEWTTGGFALAAGAVDDDARKESDHTPLKGLPLDSTAVDVIFRTNPIRAVVIPEIEEVWDGELVFEDVPIERN